MLAPQELAPFLVASTAKPQEGTEPPEPRLGAIGAPIFTTPQMGKKWEKMGKTCEKMGKTREKLGKNGKNTGKTRKKWEKIGKTREKLGKNGEKMGKHWENTLIFSS